MRYLAVILTLLCSSANVEAAAFDLGGNIVPYVMKYGELQRSGKPYPIRVCASACTLFLTLRGACLLPGAKLGFHAASRPEVTAWIMGIYPAWVRGWIARNGGLTKRVKWMPYGYAVKHMRKCG
jgi:hypothetical protein